MATKGKEKNKFSVALKCGWNKLDDNLVVKETVQDALEKTGLPRSSYPSVMNAIINPGFESSFRLVLDFMFPSSEPAMVRPRLPLCSLSLA